MFKVNVMFIIYITKIGIFYQIRKFFASFFSSKMKVFSKKKPSPKY